MKILIVDDHAVVREGLASLLQQLEPGTVILQSGCSADGLALAKAHEDLDVVLLDLFMPGLDGMMALREFANCRPDVPVIVLSSSDDSCHVRQAFDRGALGYVPKSATSQTLLLAVRLVLAGETYLPSLLLDHTRRSIVGSDLAVFPAMMKQLTERQVDVLRLVNQGRSNKEIGKLLDLSEKTVKAHMTAVLRTLKVDNREQAAQLARKAKLN